jgi:HSP20 family protein
MNLVHWNPLRELEEMSERLNRVIARSDLWRTDGKELMTVSDWTPAIDISETDGEFEITAELPEIKKEDAKVTLETGCSPCKVNGDRSMKKRP